MPAAAECASSAHISHDVVRGLVANHRGVVDAMFRKTIRKIERTAFIWVGRRQRNCREIGCTVGIGRGEIGERTHEGTAHPFTLLVGVAHTAREFKLLSEGICRLPEYGGSFGSLLCSRA